MTSNSVLIRGDGVAARCCGHLLTQAGYRVSVERTGRRAVPLIMLSEAAQRLIRDVFERDDLFRDLPAIRKRIVRWGSDPVELDHSAVVVSEEALLDRLGMVSSEGEARWTIRAATPLPENTVEHRFGSRMASAMKVEMRETGTCFVEAVSDGWLFLNSGWLLAVGSSPEESLEKSLLVRQQIAGWSGEISQFPASPRMVTPLGGDGWIACGSAAMGFDPLCGDGTAHAVREAILASAVLRAADGGGDVGELMAHYEARLTAGFERHLSECWRFYCSGGGGEWWSREAEACVRGIEWGRGRGGEFRYRLEGLELKRI
jgi:hypothetical protein